MSPRTPLTPSSAYRPVTSVLESGLHASQGSERLRDPDVRHQVHETLGDGFLAHPGGLDRGADVTGELRFGAAHGRQRGHVQHLAVAELQAVTLVRAAEHCADHPVGRARGVLVKLLLPGRGAFRGLGLCDELVALGHAQFHDILLHRTKTTRIRLAHDSRAEVSTQRLSELVCSTRSCVELDHLVRPRRVLGTTSLHIGPGLFTGEGKTAVREAADRQVCRAPSLWLTASTTTRCPRRRCISATARAASYAATPVCHPDGSPQARID